jgi:uncharacterized protein YigA (DUF484 family)
MYGYHNRYYSNPRDYTPEPEVVYIKDDKLGKERFKKLEEEFKQLERTERHNSRYNQIAAVFYHRLQIAEQAEFPRTFRDAKERLEKFKPVKVFLVAMQELIDEVKKEHDEKFKLKKAKKEEAARGHGQRNRRLYGWN